MLYLIYHSLMSLKIVWLVQCNSLSTRQHCRAGFRKGPFLVTEQQARTHKKSDIMIKPVEPLCVLSRPINHQPFSGVLLHYKSVWLLMNPPFYTDHSELHAPLPAQVSCGLCGPPQGQREIRRGELQDLCFWGNPLHCGHSIPEPPGKLLFITSYETLICAGTNRSYTMGINSKGMWTRLHRLRLMFVSILCIKWYHEIKINIRS